MVFIGGWRPRRRRGFGPYGGNAYGPYSGSGYGAPPGFGRRYRGGGSSCGRDLCLIEGGCCAAELLGCGPQATLLAPSLLRRAAHAAGGPTTSTGTPRSPQSWALRFLDAGIRLYQSDISPNRPSVCRYTPTCSEYARQALRTHGLGRGTSIAIGRLVRCRPGASGGPDPAPPHR